MRSKLVAGVAALAVASLTAGALVYAAGARTGEFVFKTGGDGIAGPPPHQPSHLLLVSNRDGDGDVYAVGAGGHPLAALTRDADDEYSLASTDGRRLAFTRDRQGPIVYTADGAGRHVRRVGTGEPLAWSPGSARLAYDAGGIVVVNANGTHRLRLTKDRDSNPPTTTFEDWSPDGRRLVFSRRVGSDLVSHDELYVVDVTQPPPKPRLLASWTGISSASWSPAGNAIAFRYYDDSSNREAVAAVDPDSGRTRVLASGEHVSGDPKWSPDGRRLLFSLGQSYSVTPLETADIEAGTSTVLAHARGIDAFAWSPDGRAVAFTAERGLGVVDADGHGLRWLRRELFEGDNYTWSPDGTRLAFVDAVGLRTIQANGRGLRTLVTRGSIELVAWVRGPVPAVAPRARPLPPIEVGSAVAFRSRGRVEQMVAAGGRAAVLSAASHLDGEHVTVWSPAARSVARGGPPDPTLPSDPNNQLGGLRISGRKVRWSSEWSCGNTECSTSHFLAIVVSPTRLRVSVRYVMVSKTDVPYAKLPCVLCGQPNPTRRHPDTAAGAISTYLSGRVIHVLRHGRELRPIRPPGRGTVFARVDAGGLFYAYNLPGGPQPGQVRFVPLRTLLRQAGLGRETPSVRTGAVALPLLTEEVIAV
jgi:TolB protein